MSFTDYEESLRSTARLARLVFSSAAASVFTCTEDCEGLVFEAASGAGEDRLVGLRLPAGQGIAGWVAAMAEPLVVRGVRADPRFDQETAAASGYIPDTIMACPITDRAGTVLGVMEVIDPVLDAEDDITALDMLTELARQAALLMSAAPARRTAGSTQADRAKNEILDILERLSPANASKIPRLVAAIAATLD